MNKAVKFIGSLILGLTVWGGASAAQTLELSLSQAVEIALNDNPYIKIAGMEIDRQAEIKKESTSNLIPTLDANGAYNRAIKKTEYDFGGQKFSFEPDNTITASLNLTVPLFVPGVYRLMSLNEQQIRAAAESARSSRIGMVSSVKYSYYSILLAERSLEVLKQSESTTQMSVDQVRKMYEQGLASEYDLVTIEVQLSNLQPEIVRTKNAVSNAWLSFRILLYLPEDINIVFTDTLEGLEQAASSSSNSYSTDISGNSQLKQIDIQKNILERQLKLVNANRMPTLAAFGNYQVMGRDKMSMSMGGPAGVPPSGMEWFTPIAAGLQLSVPIFAGFKNNHAARQVKNSISQIELQRDYAYRDTKASIRMAIGDLTAAREEMVANGKTIIQAEKGHSIASTRFQAGVGTILELTTAELTLTQAKLKYTQATVNYLNSISRYESIIGAEK